MFLPVNYIAILISAVVAFIIGALWYSPLLFGKVWAREHGYTDAQAKAMQASLPTAMIVSFITYLITAYVLSQLFKQLPIPDLATALKTGFFIWLGFPAAIGLMNAMYARKSLTVYAIDVAYQLAYILATSAIVFWWR